MTAAQISFLVSTLNVQASQINSTAALFDQGATVPFIARYRKEQTQGLDEVAIIEIKKYMDKFAEADKRREAIIKSIKEQDKLSPELLALINKALFVNELEDIYLPYKPKKKTKASEAIAKGLEPLAKIIFEQKERDIQAIAKRFINKAVLNEKEALAGARDIIAEWVADDLTARNKLRIGFDKHGILYAKIKKGKEKEAEKFKDYFEYSELIKNIPSHRYLAIKRGENEGFLKVNIEIETEMAQEQLNMIFLRGMPECKKEVELALQDSLKRLLLPSIEKECDNKANEKADKAAIDIFNSNLKQLLMASPLGQKTVMGIDPGFRTGCKIAIMSPTGALIYDDVIYPTFKEQESAAKLYLFLEKYKVEAIAIGNGTASRETEDFVKKSLKSKSEFSKIRVFMVSEQGASIYSASDIAREEFPNKDITVRGAASIGRRLMDPLAELVKLDPKSIGVGQYQHDVDQKLLRESLETVVELCVNNVGVELNTASKSLLSYVSGIGPIVAQNIIDYRNANGKFESRNELKKVPRLGDKVYEQAAGFLRIKGAKNILDNTGVHPERYNLVKEMAKNAQLTVDQFIENETARKDIELKRFINAEVGLPTLQDIMKELDKPGRDPREPLDDFEFGNVKTMDDLRTGMVLPGIVTNITAFGCFVDVGVHQDGLVHLSQMADRFIKDPNEVVKVHQKVMVKVTEIEISRKRIALSMKL